MDTQALNQYIFFLAASPEDQEGVLYFPLAQKIRVPWKRNQLPKLRDILQGTDDELPEALSYPVRITRKIAATIDPQNMDGWQSLSRLTIVPGYSCNFHCQYCYSRQQRDLPQSLRTEELCGAIGRFLEQTAHRKVTIAFTGGGEPCLQQKVIVQLTDFARRKAQERQIQLQVTLTTNGSILTPNMLDFLKDHDVQVRVSFDVLPELQNRQRGHWQTVHQNILRLLGQKVRTAVRTVLTKDSKDSIRTILQTVDQRYPNLEYLDIEPVFDASYSPQELLDFLRSFRDNLFTAMKDRNNGQCPVNSLILRTINETGTLFCPGELCILPDGQVTWCHRVAPDSDYQEDFLYGKIEHQNMDLDDDKFRRICHYGSSFQDRLCNQCFARWNCAGGCALQKKSFSAPQKQAYCTFIRETLGQLLLSNHPYSQAPCR